MGKVEWSGTGDTASNQSSVTANFYVRKSSSTGIINVPTTGHWDCSLTIGGSNVSQSVSASIGADWVLMLTLTVPITHNSDGSKSITISASAYGPSGTSYSGLQTVGSGTAVLDNIPRASSLTFPSSMTMGVEYSLDISAASDGFSHDIVLTWGGVYYPIARMVSGTQQWIFSEDLADVIPNSTSGSGTLTLHTFSSFASNPDDRTLIGSRHYPVTLVVPESVKPSITGVSISEAVSGLADKFGVYIQSKSKLSVSITASGDHKSTIQSYTTTIQGRSYAGASFTSDILTASGTINLTVKVTDSRGRTDSTTASVSVTAYSPPQITTLNAWRIDASGNQTDDGERMALQIAYAIASVGGKNDRTLTVKYRKGSAGTFETISSGTAETSYSGTVNYTDAPELSTDHTYTIQVTLADYFASVSYTIEVPTAKYILDILDTKDGAAYGKAAEERDLLDVAWNARVRKNMAVDGWASVGTAVELGGAASGHGGAVDFHFDGAAEDYTSRIIEAANGVLHVNPGKSVLLGKIANSTDVLNTLLNPTGRNTITNFNAGIALDPGLWYVFTTDGTAANAPYGGYVGGICQVVVTYKSDGTINKAYQLFMDDDGDVYYKVFKYGVSYGTWKKLTS